MTQPNGALFFGTFTEIGIIDQLARALLEAQLPKGLIRPHFAVLNHLVRLEDGRTPNELARAFQVPKTSMTHTLAGLVKHRLVVIRPNPNDGRSKCVWLTDAGRALRENLIAGLINENADLLAGFDADKLSAILPILAELRAYLDHHRHLEPPRNRPA